MKAFNAIILTTVPIAAPAVAATGAAVAATGAEWKVERKGCK